MVSLAEVIAPASGGLARNPERWLILAGLFVGAFIVGLAPIADGDIFWHLAAGREMVHRHAWLRTDPFTLSAAGRAWIDVHWLFQLGAYAIYVFAGLAGLVVVKAALVATGAVVLARTVARAEGIAGLVLCALGLLATLFLARHLLLVRPVIVTLLMLALYVSVLEHCRAQSHRWLALLPLLQVVWANCQGLSLLGPALIAAYLLGAWLSPGTAADAGYANNQRSLRRSRRRSLALALGLCLLASLATPYGLQGLALSAELVLRVTPTAGNVFAAQVAENVPPWLLGRTAAAEVGHFQWVLAAFALCLAVSGRRPPVAHLVVMVGFAGLALMANRNVLLFYWLATPMVAMAIAPRISAFATRTVMAEPAKKALVAVVLCTQIALATLVHAREPSIASPTPFHFPLESARHLQRIAAAGPIFAPDHHGGYLELTIPALRPYLDTRLVLHTAEEYAAYLAALDDPRTFDALAEANHFRYVVLTTTYPDRYLGLAQHLASSADWRLIFTDGSEVLFARDGTSLILNDPTTTDAILRRLASRFGGATALHEAARLHLARLLVVFNQPREAQIVLSTLNNRAAAQLRARAYFAAGEPAAAESLARTLIAADSEDVRSLALLAQLAIVRGQTAAGATWLRRALDVDPYDPESRAVLHQIEGWGPSLP